MASSPNALRWNGRAGHHEVYYLTVTDPVSGLGAWIRYERARQVGGWAHRQTLVAPGRAHFEYAQRSAVPDIELVIR